MNYPMHAYSTVHIIIYLVVAEGWSQGNHVTSHAVWGKETSTRDGSICTCMDILVNSLAIGQVEVLSQQLGLGLEWNLQHDIQ